MLLTEALIELSAEAEPRFQVEHVVALQESYEESQRVQKLRAELNEHNVRQSGLVDVLPSAATANIVAEYLGVDAPWTDGGGLKRAAAQEEAEASAKKQKTASSKGCAQLAL